MANITAAVGKRARDARGHWLGEHPEQPSPQPEKGRLHHDLALPDAPGVHQPGDVTGYWSSPDAQIPLGQTMLLARTDLVLAAGGHGGLPAGEDFMMVNGVTNLAAGELLPHVVYFYRQHCAQMTAGGAGAYRDLRGPSREFAFRHGRALRSALQHSRALGSANS